MAESSWLAAGSLSQGVNGSRQRWTVRGFITRPGFRPPDAVAQLNHDDGNGVRVKSLLFKTSLGDRINHVVGILVQIQELYE
jgi:hypothetical protein